MSSLCNVSNFLHLIGSISVFQCTFFSASIPFKMKIDPIFVFESENIIENVFQKNSIHKRRERTIEDQTEQFMAQPTPVAHSSHHLASTIVSCLRLNYSISWTLRTSSIWWWGSFSISHFVYLSPLVSWVSFPLLNCITTTVTNHTKKNERKCSAELSMHAMMICCVLLLCVLKNSAFCHGSSCTHMRGKRDERRMQFKD